MATIADYRSTRRRRYYPGQIVSLFQPITHEGPHEDDFGRPPRYAIIVRTHVHPYNRLWVDGYDVLEWEPDGCEGHPDGPEMGVSFFCDGSCNDAGFVSGLHVRSVAGVAKRIPAHIASVLRDARRTSYGHNYPREPEYRF